MLRQNMLLVWTLNYCNLFRGKEVTVQNGTIIMTGRFTVCWLCKRYLLWLIWQKGQNLKRERTKETISDICVYSIILFWMNCRLLHKVITLVFIKLPVPVTNEASRYFMQDTESCAQRHKLSATPATKPPPFSTKANVVNDIHLERTYLACLRPHVPCLILACCVANPGNIQRMEPSTPRVTVFPFVQWMVKSWQSVPDWTILNFIILSLFYLIYLLIFHIVTIVRYLLSFPSFLCLSFAHSVYFVIRYEWRQSCNYNFFPLLFGHNVSDRGI